MSTPPPPAAPAKRRETRAEAQARINSLRAEGKLTAAEWSVLFDELSDLKKWGPNGRRDQSA